MDKIVNVGLIGFGLGGRVFHAPILKNVDGLNLHKIYTRNENAQTFIKLTYPNAGICESLEQILEDESIELVVVATTNDTHFELARRALEADKHVVVEKPFTVTSLEAEQLVSLAESKGRLLSVHQNRRWDSDFLTVQKVIESGRLGSIVEYEAHFDRFRTNIKDTWKEQDIPGTGILYDLGSHLIDQAIDLFGVPDKVTCFMGTQRPGSKITDNFELVLHYAGMRAVLKAGLLVKEKGPHFIVHGDRGSFIKYGMDVQEEALKRGLYPADLQEWGMEPENLWGTINTIEDGLEIKGVVMSEIGDYRRFYVNVLQALKGEAALIVSAQQARNTIKIIELAIKSNAEGKTLLV